MSKTVEFHNFLSPVCIKSGAKICMIDRDGHSKTFMHALNSIQKLIRPLCFEKSTLNFHHKVSIFFFSTFLFDTSSHLGCVRDKSKKEHWKVLRTQRDFVLCCSSGLVIYQQEIRKRAKVNLTYTWPFFLCFRRSSQFSQFDGLWRHSQWAFQVLSGPFQADWIRGGHNQWYGRSSLQGPSGLPRNRNKGQATPTGN